MSKIAELLSDVPKRLRPRFAAGIVEAAKSLDAELSRTLGTPGTRRTPSRPGEAPRRQTGHLQAHTRATANPADLSIVVTTTAVGAILDAGRRDGRIKPRPWKKAALDRNLSTRRRLIYGGR